jgi:hypothetical protein
VSASYWRRCVSVRVDGAHVERELACGHRQRKPLDFLNDTTRRNPQAMREHSFPCIECAKGGVTSDSGPPEAA